MSFWNANSDRDWEEECSAYPRRVERTCAQCGEIFLMVVEGEYVSHPLCDRCCAHRDATHDEPASEKRTA